MLIINAMSFREFSGETREYNEIGSTNEELNRLLGIGNLEEGTVVRAGFQSAGKGYQGNRWLAEPLKNLLFSILLKPGSLTADKAFHLSRIVSISLVETLDKQDINTSIKWPNDIFVKSRKISGILIENSIIRNRISQSVIGVGLNVNQVKFDPGIPSPTSMCLEKGCHFDMKLLLDDFRTALQAWYQILLEGNEKLIMDVYLNRLYLRNLMSEFSDGKSAFIASIRNVLPGGELEVLVEDGEVRRYGFKEIEYVQS